MHQLCWESNTDGTTACTQHNGETKSKTKTKKTMKTPITFILATALSMGIFAQNIDTARFTRWINANSIELNEKSGFKQLAEKLNDKTIVGDGADAQACEV